MDYVCGFFLTKLVLAFEFSICLIHVTASIHAISVKIVGRMNS